MELTDRVTLTMTLRQSMALMHDMEKLISVWSKNKSPLESRPETAIALTNELIQMIDGKQYPGRMTKPYNFQELSEIS